MTNEGENRQELPDEERQRQESGVPGGGKGRRDEVGRSGVYPASEIEEAPDDVEIRQPAEWGQGERGAAGYYDHGDSEEMAFWEEVEKGGIRPGPGEGLKGKE